MGSRKMLLRIGLCTVFLISLVHGLSACQKEEASVEGQTRDAIAGFHHLMIFLGDQEEINRARDFFVDVLGFKVIRESDALGKGGTEGIPEYYCHLFDPNGLCFDLLASDEGRPSRNDEERVSRVMSLGFEVADINKTWDALNGHPVRKLSEPEPYSDVAAQSLDIESGSSGFFILDLGSTSLGIQLVELHPSRMLR